MSSLGDSEVDQLELRKVSAFLKHDVVRLHVSEDNRSTVTHFDTGQSILEYHCQFNF